jgi:hypothetical protein
MPRQRDDAHDGDDDLVEDSEESDVDDLEIDDSAPVGADADLVEVAEVELADDADAHVEDAEEDDEEEAEVVEPAIRPAIRPQPGRPPSAREEPPPPFAVGERVVLIQNTRPRTGTLIGNYPVGATGRVETVLSQTAIVRFDLAPDTKEVVAFTCLESAEKASDGRDRG